MQSNGAAMWPQVRGVDIETQADPITGIPMCKDCWNGRHDREGCKIYACKCRCYKGRNKGLGKPHAPHPTCQEDQTLPDVGTFTV